MLNDKGPFIQNATETWWRSRRNGLNKQTKVKEWSK